MLYTNQEWSRRSGSNVLCRNCTREVMVAWWSAQKPQACRLQVLESGRSADRDAWLTASSAATCLVRRGRFWGPEGSRDRGCCRRSAQCGGLRRGTQGHGSTSCEGRDTADPPDLAVHSTVLDYCTLQLLNHAALYTCIPY